MKKICSECRREFTGDDSIPTPVDVLGQIFIDAMGVQDAGNICPKCREDLGILNLLGFGGEPKKLFRK